MGAAAAVSAGLSVVEGGINFFEGRRREKAAKEALENFNFTELENVHEGRQVSTLGSDLVREENARISATGVDALRNAGTRGLIGGLGRVQQNNNLLNSRIAANLDEQQVAIDRDIANDNANIRRMRETRETNELQGIGQELNNAGLQKNKGIGQAFDGLQTGAAAIGGKGGADKLAATQQAPTYDFAKASERVKNQTDEFSLQTTNPLFKQY